MVVTFNETINPATVNVNTITVYVPGVAGLAGSYQVSDNTVTFTPTSPFPGNTQIGVQVNGVRDLAGNVNNYTNVTFQPVDVADNLKKQQANIPGIRPGKQTADYIHRVIQRITFGGAVYVAVVCVLPSIIGDLVHFQFRFGGTSLMIVVGVALDTVNQIEAHLIQRSYDGLTGPGATRIRARRLPEG